MRRVTAFFTSSDTAREAHDALLAAGVPRDDIRMGPAASRDGLVTNLIVAVASEAWPDTTLRNELHSRGADRIAIGSEDPEAQPGPTEPLAAPKAIY